ncbi:exocyst complex component exo84 [Malassezia obtusa]|uniref:Exocyst complex component EXO84 n=1 Tax=Malassezia obtusa TaxID=76774 RepID=A0AAF0DYT2_9BASI|nr:exocyst complex component exo84 [Malassezia obtusa]
MSRSLRSRPTTLYAKDGHTSGMWAPQGFSSYQTSRPMKKPIPTEADAEEKVRNRLSMRYASGATPAPAYANGLSMLAPIAGVPEEKEEEESAGVAPSLSYLQPAASATSPLPAHPVASPSVPPSEAWEAFSRTPQVDAGVFAQENFDARAFVSTQQQQQNESGLRNLKEVLSNIQNTTSKQLKTQVFKNYSEFITISKEIATLENDMLEFKDLLSEWKQLPQQLQIEDPAGDASKPWGSNMVMGSVKGNRGSRVDLEQIYKAQIAALWENIEGSQKFVPYIPGRHLIAETSQFVEVNAATYKPKQAVALFLLDDLLLIAVQRKRHYGNRVHLVAEQCFGLSEIVVVDLKDSKDLKNALKIKRGKEVYVYRTDKVQDKRALLNAFRRVGEDLGNKMKRERKSKADAKRADAVLSDSMDLAPGSLPGDNEKETKPDADLAPWLNSAVDDLAVHIALREWEEAVALVEEGRRRLANRPVSEGPLYLLVENFNSCASELVSAISAELVAPFQRKATVVRDATLLLRLDKGREARDLLLSSRTELLRRRTRQIKYEGDVSLYISELAMLYFTLIKNTGDWYMSAFKDYKMASGFVQWASDQVRSYAATFRRQVYGVDQDPQVVKEAKDITMSSAQILNDVGLGLTFLLEYVTPNCSVLKKRAKYLRYMYPAQIG